MPICLRCLLVATLLVCAPALALFEKVPFIGSQFPFRIDVMGNSDLASNLTDTLTQQRKESAEFALYESTENAAQFDRGILLKSLESRGYFAAKVSSKRDKDYLIYTVEPGPLYTLAAVSFEFPESITTPHTNILPMQIGSPFSAQLVLKSVDTLRAYIQQNYCLYDIQLQYSAQVNHQTHQGFVRYTLEQSQDVRFAKPYIFGATTVANAYLRKQLTFKKGECFNRTAIEKSRLALLQTNLVAKVDTQIGAPIAGQVTVNFEITERSQRTIKAGVGYNTDSGENLLLGWQHRNLFGSAQKLDTQLDLADIEQSIKAELTLPNYIRDDQTLLIEANITRETPAAFEALQGEASATLSRQIFKHWNASVGAGIEFSRVTKEGIKEDYGLVSTPIGLDYNHTDNLLNPKKGWALALKTRPYINMYQTGVRFIEHSFLASTYLTAANWPTSPTLAMRVAGGTISDESFADIPADHRFYVGGGGSVRGYKYQSLSALQDGAPLGGLSFSSASIELRLQATEHWGVVFFGDGGFAFADRTPKFFKDYLTAAGIGIRYYTSFAPIRFDVAKPLDIRRTADNEKIDAPFQIYISIGQAF